MVLKQCVVNSLKWTICFCVVCGGPFRGFFVLFYLGGGGGCLFVCFVNYMGAVIKWLCGCIYWNMQPVILPSSLFKHKRCRAWCPLSIAGYGCKHNFCNIMHHRLKEKNTDKVLLGMDDWCGSSLLIMPEVWCGWIMQMRVSCMKSWCFSCCIINTLLFLIRLESKCK